MEMEEKKISAAAEEARKNYFKSYAKKNPEKVAVWRKQAIVNAYKKLIAAEPEWKVNE